MILGAIKAWLVRTGISNLALITQMERDGYTFDFETKGSWIGTLPNEVLIVFGRDVGICDRFLFVDLCDTEMFGAFAQIKVNYQIAVVEHVMADQ